MKLEKARLIYRLLFITSLVCLFVTYISGESGNIKMAKASRVLLIVLQLVALIIGLMYLRCPDCGKALITARKVKYCPHCGKELE